MINMEQSGKYKGSQNFALIAVSMGILLIVVAIISGTQSFLWRWEREF